LDTRTTFLSGPSRAWFLSRVGLRLFRRLGDERGYPRATLDLLHAVLRAGAWDQTPGRLVRHGGHVWAVPDLPPLDTASFLDCLTSGLGGFEKGPVTAILSLTARCPHRCPYCYVRRPGPDAPEPSVALLARTVEGLAALGVRTIHLSGGEPALRCDDVAGLLARCRGLGLRFWMLTTGAGLSPERLRTLAAAGLDGVMIGLDHDDPAVADGLKGTREAHATALRALGDARRAGLLAAVNTVVSRSLLDGDAFLRFIDFLGGHGATFVNCYAPRPQGAELPSGLAPFTVEEHLRLHRLARRLSAGSGPRPLVYTPDVWEALRGCQGGRSFLYVDPAGDVRRCPFLGRSYGRIQDGDLAGILARMRADPEPETCAGHLLLAGALRRGRS